jgi:hypothetical protein
MTNKKRWILVRDRNEHFIGDASQVRQIRIRFKKFHDLFLQSIYFTDSVQILHRNASQLIRLGIREDETKTIYCTGTSIIDEMTHSPSGEYNNG